MATATIEAIPLEPQTYVEGSNQVHLMLPKGTRLVKVDPSGEAIYLELKVKTLALCEEMALAPLDSDYDKKQAELKLGTSQKLIRAIDDLRKKYTVPIDSQKAYLQDVFKKSLIDPLTEAKGKLSGRVDDYNNRLLAEQAEQRRKDEEARKAQQAEEIIDPGYVPPPPPTTGVMADVKTSRTEAGTRFSKKTVEYEVIDFEKLPTEYKKLVVDEDKLKAAVNKATEGINDPCIKEDLILGVNVKVYYKGQMRT
ncbi:MAG: hypothetical protein PHQ43_00010 [Dehalococcoidales bacterium]|nr:hypothetical protein [Dehalococcoidales bacterium]